MSADISGSEMGNVSPVGIATICSSNPLCWWWWHKHHGNMWHARNSLHVFHMGLSVEADNTGWWELGCNMESSTVICEIIRSHNFELVMSYYHSDICCESPPRRGGVAFAALTCLTFRGLRGTVVETIAMDNGKWRYHVLECIEDSHRMVVWGVEILFSGVTSKDQASPLQGCKMESSFTPDHSPPPGIYQHAIGGILGATYVGTAHVYSHSEFGSVSPGGVLASTSVSTASPGGVLAAMPINTAFGCHQGASWTPAQTLSATRGRPGRRLCQHCIWVSPGGVLDSLYRLYFDGVPQGGILAATSVNTACMYYYSEFSWLGVTRERLGRPLRLLSATRGRPGCQLHQHCIWVSPGGVLDGLYRLYFECDTKSYLYFSQVPPGGVLATNSVNTAFECHKGASRPPTLSTLHLGVTGGWLGRPLQLYFECMMSSHTWILVECHKGASWPLTLSTLHLGVTGGHLGRPLQLYFECMMSSHTWILVECHQGASWPPTLSTLHLGVTGGHLGRPLQLYFECMMSSHTWILVECHQGASWPPTLSTLHNVVGCHQVECHQGASWPPPPSALQACTLTGNLVVCHQGSVLAALPDQLGVASGHPGCTLPLQVRYDTANALVGIQDAHTTACSMLVT
ncbi:hypothetical protein EV401DRAFT_1888798 [Pisolithus croceorrhizus]|nr:hypothetical protein EV401DRAFT_1888798 [Pisolithus croceorrhizus]